MTSIDSPLSSSPGRRARAPRPATPSVTEHGFARLDGFADAAEVADLRALVDARRDGPVDGACERPHNTLLPLRWDDPLVALLLDRPERVHRLAALIAARDLRWVSGYISTKEPRSAPLWWHQDWWCWDHPESYRPDAPQVALLVYLGDTDASNGALRVLPGSHRRSAPIHALLPEAHGAEAETLDPRHPALADLPGQLSLPVRAGDAVVLDYRLLHGTHANETGVRRDALLLTFAPAWRDLAPDLRGHLVDHPALPGPGEPEPPHGSWAERLLPRFSGRRATLPLNRDAPAEFAIGG